MDLSALNNQTVLVTGATGFTGSYLVKKLIALGAKVKAVARPSSNREQFKNLPIKWFIGEVYDEETLKKATKDVNYIFHLAAAYRQAKIKDQDYQLVHVESTKILATLAKNLLYFKRFVHLSTVGVHGHIENPPADENAPYNPGDVYQKTKLEAEIWFREYAENNNLDYAVVRPAAIYGPGDGRIFKIFKMSTWSRFPILGSGKCLYHLIHVEDLCDAILLSAVHPKASKNIFVAGNETSIPLEKIVKIIADEYALNTKIIRIPVTPFFVLASICEAICKPLGIEPPLYRRRVAFYTKDRSFNTSKISNLLDFKTKYTNESGLRATAAWYLENSWLKINNAKV